MKQKTCTRCAQRLSVEDFYPRRDRKDGRVSRCKQCWSGQNKAPAARAARAAWYASPRGKFYTQQKHAKRRGIPFILTFEEWWGIWEPHWERRGRRAHELVMGRLGDTGPYAAGNVKILSGYDNGKESLAAARH